MGRLGQISINLEVLLLWLFRFYAFSLPFELFFEVMFDIDTIFKPFRIIGLSILSVYGIKVLKEGLHLNVYERNDLFYYCAILYGIIISCIRIMEGPFNINLFYNDLFLISLNVLIFFIFKNTKFIIEEFHSIIWYLIAGIIANGLYIFYSFNFLGVVSRQSGFSDNPNYTALGTAMAITFLLLKSNFLKTWWKQFLLVIISLILLYVFMITGSRTGLIILIVSLFLVFIFASIYRKILVVFFGILAGVIFMPSYIDNDALENSLVLVKRINSKMDQEEVDVRFVIWDGVFRMLENEGYWGMGIGQYKDKFDSYFTSESHLYIVQIVERGYFLSTHNEYLAILTDFGLPALVLYLAFLGFHLLKRLKNQGGHSNQSELSLFISQYQLLLICCLIIFNMASENLPNPLYNFLLMVGTKHQ